MKTKLILASVVSLTLMGAAPAVFAADRNDNRIEAREEAKMPYSQVPGEVKRAIEPNLNSGDKVTDVYKFNRGGRTVYVAYTNDERVIRADDRGNLLSVKSTDDEKDANERTRVKYNSLPGEVKNTLGKQAKGHPMEVYQINRGKKVEYVAYIDDNEGTHKVGVDKDGNIIDRPVLLSDRGDTRDKNRDDINARRRADREQYRSQGQEIDWSEVPGKVKGAVGSEMGQNTQVGNVIKLNRNGKTVYRVELDNETTARTLWVDENGEQLREMNTTEEGRKRVDMSDLPGNVKSALINEANGKEPKRIWQVTRGHDTWYVGEAEDGHLVRIDDSGKVMSHDSNPNLLSDRNENRDRNRDRYDNNNAGNDNERNRNRDRNEDKKYENERFDPGRLNAVKVDMNDVPKAARDAIRDNLKGKEKISEVYKVKTDEGSIHYVAKTNDDRTIRVGEHGGLLGQTK